MMDKMQFLEYLVEDAKGEYAYMLEHEAEIEKARTDNAIYSKVWNMRTPSRQRIKDDLKMIRRVTMELERNL
jgi:phosphoglycerate-specific signal transduction histidine kinase